MTLVLPAFDWTHVRAAEVAFYPVVLPYPLMRVFCKAPLRAQDRHALNQVGLILFVCVKRLCESPEQKQCSFRNVPPERRFWLEMLISSLEGFHLL